MVLRGLDLFFERRGYPYKVDDIPHMIDLIKTFRIPEVVNNCNEKNENDHENQSQIQSEGESEDDSDSDSDSEMGTDDEDKEGMKLKRSEECFMYEAVANVIGYFHKDAVMAYSSEPLGGYKDKGQGNGKTEGKPLPAISVCIHLSGKREVSNDLLSKFFYGDSDLLTYATATTCLKKEKNPFVDVTLYPLFEAMNKLVSVVIVYDKIESERGGGGGHAAAANSIISGGCGQEKEQDDQDQDEDEDQEDEDQDEDEDLEDMEEDMEEDLEEDKDDDNDNEATGATHASSTVSSTSYRYRLTPIVIKKLGLMGIETMFLDKYFLTEDFLKFIGIKSVKPYVLPPHLAKKKSLHHDFFKKMVRDSDAVAIYLNLKRNTLVCVTPLFDEDDPISFNTPEIFHVV